MAVDDSYTKSLLHFDGSDASTTFTDESGKTWTAVGDAQLDTSAKKFGTASGQFDGTNDCITSSSTDFNVGSGLFTIDFWVKTNVVDTRMGFVSTLQIVPATRVGWNINVQVTNVFSFRFYSGGVSTTYSLASNPTLNDAFHHVAVVKKGSGASDLGIAIDGSFEWFDGNFSVADAADIAIAREWSDTDSDCLNGRIDEFRFSLGVARWSDDFTPPTAPYGPITEEPILRRKFLGVGL